LARGASGAGGGVKSRMNCSSAATTAAASSGEALGATISSCGRRLGTRRREYLRMQLVLREWTEDDAPALSRAIAESLEHLRPWMPWAADEPRTDEQRRAWIREGAARDDEVFGMWLDGEVVGGSGLHHRIGDDGLEIGYWLAKTHTGRGIITRAVALLTEEAFRVGANRVEIVHDAANVRSGAIPARLGFTEVARKPKTRAPSAPGECGIDVIWRREP
jgi:ribosomal-protein-serine acetyltransferase